MKHSVRETGTWQHTLDVEVPAEAVDAELDHLARAIQRRAVLPGFRRGKVPIDQVRQNFAEHIEHEFFDSILPRVTQEAMSEAKLVPVVPPTVRNIRFTPGQPLRFEAVVDVRPQVDAGEYKGLPLKRHRHPIGDEQVDRVLAGLQDEAAVFADLDRAAEKGDVVLVDSTRLDANGRRMAGTTAKNRRVPLGDLMTDWLLHADWLPGGGIHLSTIQQWIMDVPQNTAKRAILIGAALGVMATGLRVILGIERSYLSGEE